jgi:hypothetical protein
MFRKVEWIGLGLATTLGMMMALASQASAQQYNYRYNGLAPGVAPSAAYGYGDGYYAPPPPPGLGPEANFADPYPTLDSPPPGWRGQPMAAPYRQGFIPIPQPRPQVASLQPKFDGMNDADIDMDVTSDLQATAKADPVTRSVTPVKSANNASIRRPGVPFSCAEGENVVAGLGFANVKATDCEARIMRYVGEKQGKNYEVRVSASNGEVTEVRMQP